ncbi:MAG: D-aminoacyl-tRNA deacylase [Bacillota bacterium]
MRAVVQRVTTGRVKVGEETTGEIEKGLVVFLGVTHNDSPADAQYLAEKIGNLRIFEDGDGKLNLSVLDVKGKILSVSQFTLFGDCRKGRRPSFTEAASPDTAQQLYEIFNNLLRNMGLKVETGIFQAHMQVELINDGPVTILLDSRKIF